MGQRASEPQPVRFGWGALVIQTHRSELRNEVRAQLAAKSLVEEEHSPLSKNELVGRQPCPVGWHRWPWRAVDVE